MTRQPLLPSPAEARRLADLVADALAIPRAAFAPCAQAASASGADVQVSPEAPVRSLVVRIPRQTASLIEAAEHHWADFSR